MQTPMSLLVVAGLCGVLGGDVGGGVPTMGRPTTARPSAKPIVRPRTGAAKPRAIPRARRSASATPIVRPLKRDEIVPRRSQTGSAVLADLLIRFADGKTETRVDKNLRKRLTRDPAKVAAARRLAGRLKAAGAADRRKSLGRTTLGRATGKKVMGAVPIPGGGLNASALRPTIPLAPQSVSLPTHYDLKLAGIQSISPADGDGTDELAMLVIRATMSNGSYVLESVDVPKSGTIAAPGGSTTTVGATVYDDKAVDMLLVTAMVEDDGGNAEAARAEVEAMVDVAASAAEGLEGKDRLAVLHTMVDYTAGLAQINAAPQAAPRSIVSTRIAPGQWAALWGVDATSTDGLNWKIAVPHILGSGNYEMLLDIPSVLPPRTTVRVAVDKVWIDSLDSETVSGYLGEARVSPFQMEIDVGVNGESGSLAFEDFVFTKASPAVFERQVLPGNVDVELGISLLLADAEFASTKGGCLHGSTPNGCVAPSEEVDVAPGSAKVRKVVYDPAKNRILKRARGGAPNRMTTKGSEVRFGGITFEITDRD